MGGAGYIGSSVVRKLQDHGHTVDVVDLLWFGQNLPADVGVRRVDILELNEEDLAGYDQVIFLAGLSNDPMAEYDARGNFVYNGACPTYAAYLAKNAGVSRFIYASSCSVYGNTNGNVCDESSAVTCRYPYGVGKLQGELGVMQFQDEGFSVICLRQGTVCGHSPRMRFDLVVNAMFKCAHIDGIVTVNNPKIWRPILDLRDAQDAYIQAVQARSELSGVYNVASGNYTVGEMGEIVKRKFKERTGVEVKVQTKHVVDYRNYRVSCRKATDELGFRPTRNVSDIVDQLCSMSNRYGDLSDDIFYNIKVFSGLRGC